MIASGTTAAGKDIQARIDEVSTLLKRAPPRREGRPSSPSPSGYTRHCELFGEGPGDSASNTGAGGGGDFDTADDSPSAAELEQIATMLMGPPKGVHVGADTKARAAGAKAFNASVMAAERARAAGGAVDALSKTSMEEAQQAAAEAYIAELIGSFKVADEAAAADGVVTVDSAASTVPAGGVTEAASLAICERLRYN